MAPAASKPATAGRHDAGGEQDDHYEQHRDGLLGAGSHRQCLTAHEVRRIHHQNIRIVEVDVERLPGALQEHRIASLQSRDTGAEIVTPARGPQE